MKVKIVALVFVLSLLLIGPGCVPAVPTCSPSELMAVFQIEPPMWGTVTTLHPSLRWAYPNGPYEYSYPGPYYSATPYCRPERYRVTLRTGPFFTDDLGGLTVGNEEVWTPAFNLQPGTEYAWGIQPISGGVYGPYAGYRYFFTGPTCATSALVAPNLLEPANGATISDDYPSLIWDYPDPCIPNGYRVDLSKTSDFSDTSLSGGTGNPSTRWGPGEHLDNCTWYFWKIAPINDTTLGPSSTTFNFFVDRFNTCLSSYHYPDYHILVAAACRFGPTLDYNIMEYLRADDTFPAEGRNPDASWFLVRIDPNRRCWVSGNLGNLDGNPNDLPVEKPPELVIPLPGPTDTPVPYICSAYQDPRSCAANPNCYWAYTQLQVGYCTNK